MDNISKLLEKIGVQINTESIHLTVFCKFLAALAVSVIAWLILLYILSFAKKRLEKYEKTHISDQIFPLARKVLGYTLIFVTGTYIINLLNIQLFEKLFYATLILLLSKPAVDFVKILLAFLQKNIADRTDTNIDNILFELLDKFTDVIIFTTAIILALDTLGINVMPFVAGAGIAGVAIGFAAKDTLSNLIAGVTLLIDRPFEMGDRIEMWSTPPGTASWGDVIDIGLRATKIRTTDNIIVIIPNNEIMTRDIVNYTANSSDIRVRVNIGVAYNTDIPKAKQTIIGVANSAEWVKKEPAPVVVVRNFGESAIDLQLRVWISNARKRMDTISYITDNVKDAFDKNGIEIPYPKRDIRILS